MGASPSSYDRDCAGAGWVAASGPAAGGRAAAGGKASSLSTHEGTHIVALAATTAIAIAAVGSRRRLLRACPLWG